MQLEEKAKVYGGVATILFHILLLLALIFFCFERIMPEEEDGVPLSMGMPDMGGDDLFEPTPETEVPEVAQAAPTPAPSQPAPAVAPNVETQTLEQTVAVPTSKKKVEKPSTQSNAADKEELKKKEELRQQELKRKQELAAEEARKKAIAEEEARKKAEQEAIKKKANNAANVFKKKADANGTDANSSGTGTGSKSGNQGDPNGSAGGGKGGSGNRWSLEGRQIVGTLPRPSYTANEQGYVVVNITVDNDGNVVSAEIGKCVGITASSLRNAALQAAKKAKFSSKSEGRFNQKGTITYHFKLQ